jgi:hypothetical protein
LKLLDDVLISIQDTTIFTLEIHSGKLLIDFGDILRLTQARAIQYVVVDVRKHTKVVHALKYLMRCYKDGGIILCRKQLSLSKTRNDVLFYSDQGDDLAFCIFI